MRLNKQYKTGILWQDTQHQQLVELMEKLSDSNSKESAPAMFVYTTAFLAMYVTHHFSLEENYMKTYEYPDLKFHLDEHKKFIATIKKFRKEHTTFSKEGTKFLEQNILKWILEHIMKNDQKLGEFILKEEEKRILAKAGKI